MNETTRGTLQRIPSLVSLTTIAMAAGFLYECPSGMFSLLCAVSGSCTLIAGDRNIHLAGSRMAFLSGNIRYQMKDASRDLAVSRLDFSTSLGSICGYGLAQIAQVFPRSGELMEEHGSCVEFEDPGAVILSALRNLQSFSAFPPEQRNLQTFITLCVILGGISTALHLQNGQPRCFNPHVRKALDYIEANYMISISTEDIAEAAGVHVGHLHRIFPEEVGMTIGEYLTHLRIEKARKLLMHTDISNASIASRIGISSQQYFCRMFKKETGISPQEYRKSYALTCHYDPEFYPAPIVGNDPETEAMNA
ncbi:MAG: helix-turn-helix transcriptional regulator [Clostridia bacterium]|nr:helix-turn-helix transcriptional regulator [Clostridia bacterium]